MVGKTHFERASMVIACIQVAINIIVPIGIFIFFKKRQQQISDYCRHKKIKQLNRQLTRESTLEYINNQNSQNFNSLNHLNSQQNSQTQLAVNQHNLNLNPKYKYFDKIFIGFKQDEFTHSIKGNMTLILFFARRLLIPCALTFFRNEKWAQWLSYLLTTVVVLIWVLTYKPYVQEEKQFVEQFAEGSLMVIILILPLFEFVEQKKARNVLGWIVNSIVIITNLFLIGYLIVFYLRRCCKQSLVQKWRKIVLNKVKLKEQEKKKDISPINVPSITFEKQQSSVVEQKLSTDLGKIMSQNYQMVRRDSYSQIFKKKKRQKHEKVHPQTTEEAVESQQQMQEQRPSTFKLSRVNSRRENKLKRKSILIKRLKSRIVEDLEKGSDHDSSPEIDVFDVKFNTDQFQMSPFIYSKRVFRSISIINGESFEAKRHTLETYRDLNAD